jgi:hypothetical protein
MMVTPLYYGKYIGSRAWRQMVAGWRRNDRSRGSDGLTIVTGVGAEAWFGRRPPGAQATSLVNAHDHRACFVASLLEMTAVALVLRDRFEISRRGLFA